MVSRRARIALAFWLVSSSITNIAAAAPDEAAKAHARTLMKEGRACEKEHDLQAALKSFEAADAIMGLPTTAIAAARTQAELKLMVESRSTIDRLLLIPTRADDPPAFERARAEARALRAELETKTPSLRITIRRDAVQPSPASTPQVMIDGSEAKWSAANDPLRLNPGHHAVTVAVDGVQHQEEIDLGEGDTKEIVISLPAPPVVPSTEPALPVAVPPPSLPLPSPVIASGPPEESHVSTKRVLTLTGTIVGGVGIVVGSATGIASLVATHATKSQCPGGNCATNLESNLSTDRALATTSDVAFIIAGAGVVAAVWGIAMKSERPATAGFVRPWVAPGQAGLVGNF